MKALLRFVLVACLLGMAVVPLSAGPMRSEDHGVRGARELQLSRAKFARLQKSMTCFIFCSNGDYAEKTVETRGGCLDACESFCGERCQLLD